MRQETTLLQSRGHTISADGGEEDRVAVLQVRRAVVLQRAQERRGRGGPRAALVDFAGKVDVLRKGDGGKQSNEKHL